MLRTSTSPRKFQLPVLNHTTFSVPWFSTTQKTSLRSTRRWGETFNSQKILDSRSFRKSKPKRRQTLPLKNSGGRRLKQPRNSSRSQRPKRRRPLKSRHLSTRQLRNSVRLCALTVKKLKLPRKRSSSSRPDGWCKIISRWTRMPMTV